MHKWLSIIGIGEDGLAGLNPVARSLLEQSELLVGGNRHLALLPPNDRQERLPWASPLVETVETIVHQRGRAICILASGDPLCYGIGTTLLRYVPASEMTIVPAPSAFSLACARLGWSLPDVETLSLNGRDPALLQPFIYAGARLLILSGGRQTPPIVADLLTRRGFGHSPMTVLEHMGGHQERILAGQAKTWARTDLADLNTIAVNCVADPGVVPLPRLAGLPDTAYHHDGQLTKREVRAMTLAALAPLPGQLLWDVGAGCGSIGIEWMRSHPRCRAIAIEPNTSRLRHIADNATALGVPNLQTIAGKAPLALQDLPTPDAIFIGGGASAAGVLEQCWQALPPGGRLVVNAVTVETEQKLFQWQTQVGGTLSRIAIQRAEPVGGFLGWRAMAPITQWIVAK
ncbi:cobalamin biosynthesis bifunctional protein CbiET [Leptolyngbya sp. 'hensonii']|uniref:precorrin-6y C5,15-methyltransferase (decarboxylating) subunit CbiE n=1 Tax=Leptolyngbya sp. 'hensonii' TaxID=1922337 RepID=UPI000950245C|nr:precorrin-6y C5,15-methyltransferase (decarboxylating) subunit CbiE [Leptolyngbya sp. 'hensonii']OLP17313.1 cobalamin biosynthesis bifunctional protein CbiET [Leptolyngbya sp. 'hensonii']